MAMNSPKPPNPKILHKLIMGCCLSIVAMGMGCGEYQKIEIPARVSGDKEVLISHQIDGDRNASLDQNASLEQEEEDRFRTNSIFRNNDELPGNAISKSTSSDRRPPILAIQLPDSIAMGVPIGLFSNQTLLMRNDGSIQRIPKSSIVKQTILNDRFTPIDRSELSQQLRAEFGRNYLVKSEGPYLVVARPDHMDDWLQRFRSLFHSFRLYCNTHHIATREVEFPLVAVVFGSHAEFLRYASLTHAKLPKDCAGFYFSDSNRIALFESPEWSLKETQTIICHEATHQIAFNAGLHQREASQPLWVVEGFASIFESPMLSGLQSRDGKSLWAASRRNNWKAISKRPEAVLRLIIDLVQNDNAFKVDSQNAYSVSWAMSLYLSQRRSQQYGAFLQRCGCMAPFQEYTSAQRARDFENAFGTDPRLLTNKIINYLDDLD